MTTDIVWQNEQTATKSAANYGVINAASNGWSTSGQDFSTRTVHTLLLETEETLTDGMATESMTEPLFMPIVTDTTTEQVLTALFLFFCWFYVDITNLFLSYVMWKETHFHTPQYMVLASYMLCDLIYINILLPNMIALVISNVPETVPLPFCEFVGLITSGIFFTMAHMVGYMAYERFVNFFRPLTYNSYFSFKQIVVVTVILHVIGQTFSIAIQIVAGRDMVTTGLTCQPDAAKLQFTNPIILLLFFLPPAIISGIVLIRLGMLISRHKALVAAQPSAVESNQIEKERKKQVFSVKKAIKMVSLVSGSFLITTLPSVFIRIGIFSSGVTWKQTDTRENMTEFALSRFSYFSVAVLSSLINPLIYVYAQNDLRKYAKKYLGLKVKLSDEDMSVADSITAND